MRTNRADSDLINELQNQEITTEDDLSASVTETDRMRELQDKVACLRAQVSKLGGVVMVMVVMVVMVSYVFPQCVSCTHAQDQFKKPPGWCWYNSHFQMHDESLTVTCTVSISDEQLPAADSCLHSSHRVQTILAL